MARGVGTYTRAAVPPAVRFAGERRSPAGRVRDSRNDVQDGEREAGEHGSEIEVLGDVGRRIHGCSREVVSV